MSIINTLRMPCCVCKDPATLDSSDYVTVILCEPDDGMTQYLGAHASCLRRVFPGDVYVCDPDNPSRP